MGLRNRHGHLTVNVTSTGESGTKNAGQDEWNACTRANNWIDTTFQSFFVISVLITVGLSFIVRRRNRCLKCCCGRPGILQPLNFIDDIGRRWAYAACFVILTYNVMILFSKESYWNFMPKENREWMKKFGWVKVFNKLWEVLSVCLVYYPLLACVDHRRSIAANIVGILYLIPWILVYTMFFISCPMRFNWGVFGFRFHIFRAPIYAALYIVGVSYLLDLAINVKAIFLKCRKQVKKVKTLEVIEDERDYKVSHHLVYVTNLLHKKRDLEFGTATNIIKRKSRMLAKRVKYEKIFGFRYSTRLLCCLTVAVTILFWVMFATCAFIEALFVEDIQYCITSKSLYSAIPFVGPLVTTFCETITVLRILMHIANGLSGFFVMCFLLNSLITYKQRWHQLLRGDHSWHVYGSRIPAPQNTLLNGLKFGGYQVAYAVWGWMVMAFVLFLFFTFITYQLIFPLMKGETSWFIELTLDHWATLFLGIVVLPNIQKLVCRLVFLQGKGLKLALDNRRLYNAASYYFLILNIIVGIFSCLKRILIPLVLGIAFLSRLDQPLIMKGYERRDPGYCAFVSMLLVDLSHNHPIVKTFVELLLQANQRKKTIYGSGMKDLEQVHLEEKMRRSRQIRNRWLKTLTLINNPSLALTVLEKRLKEELKTAIEQNSAAIVVDRCVTGVDILAGYYENKRSSIQILMK